MSEPRPPSAASPDERDAWLSQALRHTPDAAAGPPHALRQAILAEACSAVQPRRNLPARARQTTQATLTDRVAAFWSWLARPPVAAGFASVMAATLVGLMWWDRPMDESMTAPTATRTVRPDEVALPPAAPVTADAPASPSPADAPPATHTLPAPNATAMRRANAPRAEPIPAGVAEEKQRKDGTPASAMQAVPSMSPFPGNDRNRSESAARNQVVGPDQVAALELAKKSEAETTATASTPRVVATEPSGGAAPAEQTRSADAALADAKSAGTVGAAAKASPPQRERAAVSSRAAADALDSRAPAAPQAFAAAPARQAAATNVRPTSADASARPMASLLESLSRRPERWSRLVAGAEASPLDAATQAWLASVDTATAGRWQATSDRTIRLEGALAGEPSSLLLNQDGRAASIVRIEDRGVAFELSPGPSWFASLSGEAVARLRASLPPARR